MPGLNLTRDEASQRGALLRIDAYDIELDFSAGGDVFPSVTVSFNLAPGVSLGTMKMVHA